MGKKKPYDKIYLIGWYEEYPRPGDFGDEVTWCQDQIGEDDDCPDIEYIRADLVTAKDARIAKLIQNIRDMKYWAESGYPMQTIKIADEALQEDKE